MATRKVRYKKLNVKTPLSVLREGEIDPSEYESLTIETQIATGVEQAEENEYHLQVVLQNAVTSADSEIPVPPPEESQINYDELYPLPSAEPATFIRFSQTVEECIGCLYDMTEEDDEFLKEFNKSRTPAARLSEDDFERIMEVFEDTATNETPFASIDNTIIPYDRMVPGLNQLDGARTMVYAKEIYEYWRSRRQALSNRPLHPTLKYETHQDSDDMDPFVCFRRREVRQTRKTRARDVQSADKLKRLRRELEDGRELILFALDREEKKRLFLNNERLIYEQREKLKEMKVRLGIKTNDDDLINIKQAKRKATDASSAARTSAPTALRLPVRPDGRAVEADLPQLADKLAEKENELRIDLEMKIENHRKWNQNHVDLTRDPLSPVKGRSEQLSFRPAKTQYLMTPPASASSESMEEPSAMDLDRPEPGPPVYQFRGVPTDDESSSAKPPAFRRRIGRLNRLWIDRRGLPSPPREASDGYSDRWRYDQDSDDEDQQPAFEVDPYDTHALKFRATIPLSNFIFPRRPNPQEGLANGVPQLNGIGSSGRPALPQPKAQPQAAK